MVTHQVFDLMWDSPETWFWPTQGWEFAALDIDVWEHWLSALVGNPYVITTEILGVIVMVLVIWYYQLNNKKNFTRLLETGQLGD